MQSLKLGIFGFGCVGQGLVDVLDETTNFNVEVKKICIKDPAKSRTLDASFFTLNASELIDDPEIDIIVELIDDAEAAFEIVSKSLQNGKAVVSANKKMIAENLAELIELQQENQTPLLYEASCCASIPIIRNLEEYYDHDLLSSVSGIVNGSTNYILSQMSEFGNEYETALEEAKSNGFAETDPSLDVMGIDACYKLCIILFHSFGLIVEPKKVFTSGITSINAFDIDFAKKNGSVIKLLANAGKKNNQVTAFCIPTFVPEGSILSQTRNEYNSVILETAFTERQVLMGKGAGSRPTGSAVLSDISALTYDYKYEFKKFSEHSPLELAHELVLRVYVRYDQKNKPELNQFEQVHETFSSSRFSYLLGEISLENLRNAEWRNNPNISVIHYPLINGRDESAHL